MLTIERHDIKKLEDYIERIEQYRKEMKFTQFELLNNTNDKGGTFLNSLLLKKLSYVKVSGLSGGLRKSVLSKLESKE